MELIPAVDLHGGEVVRLRQGDYAQATRYHADPLAVAKEFEALGARRLHVVDLDGARTGRAENSGSIQSMVAQTSLRIQVGGGIRSRDVAERWLELGVARVVLGTAAAEQPEMTQQLCASHPDAVIVAADGQGKEVVVRGWQKGSGLGVVAVAQDAAQWGAAAILYTDVHRDGTEAGPNVEATAELQSKVGISVIASGGIGTLDHLRQLAQAGIHAAVCGRALYEGRFNYAQALEVCSAS